MNTVPAARINMRLIITNMKIFLTFKPMILTVLKMITQVCRLGRVHDVTALLILFRFFPHKKRIRCLTVFILFAVV